MVLSIPNGGHGSRRRGWLPYALAGGAAVIVIAVLVVLTTTGAFDGGGVPATQAGATETANTAVPGVPAEILATVAGRSITNEQLDRRAADFEAQYAGRIPDRTSDPEGYRLFQQGVLDYMITYELVTQKANALNITVTDTDVQTEIDLIRETSYGGDQGAFDAALAEQGVTMDRLKQSYAESLLLQKVYTEVTKDVTTVPDADIQAYYDKNKTDTYADKSLEEVKEEITSTLLTAKKSEVWRKWIAQAKAESGVTYADGWKPTVTTKTPVP